MVIPPGTQDAVRAFYGGYLAWRRNNRRVPWRIFISSGLLPGRVRWNCTSSPIPLDPMRPTRGTSDARVEDLEKYRLRLAEAGVTSLPAEPIPQRPRFFCLDPFGNRLEFTTILGDYQEAP
jgi:hypothetical protein